MPNDVETPFCFLQSLTGASVVSTLVEIQRFKEGPKKATSWVENLECLSVSKYDEYILELDKKPRSGADSRNYVAVSHAWDYSVILETVLNGRYRARINGEIPLKPCRLRDEVLDRIVAYAQHFKVLKF